jgi:serine/threonine-protein kinase RsbT
MPEAKQIVINNDLDIVTARVEGRNLARTLGFGVIDQARIATAISELARNIVLYAKTGTVIVRPVENERQRGIEIVCSDNGPGIADVSLVMRDGYSSHRGLGMGLPGTKRLMDEFAIESQPGVGTTVTVRKWLR